MQKRYLVILIGILTLSLMFSLYLNIENSSKKTEISVSGEPIILSPEELEGIGSVSINTATLDELELLPEIGPKTASEIINYRETHGPFLKIEDIKNVKGIGEKTFEKIRKYIST